jgi:hypothetical protein
VRWPEASLAAHPTTVLSSCATLPISSLSLVAWNLEVKNGISGGADLIWGQEEEEDGDGGL